MAAPETNLAAVFARFRIARRIAWLIQKSIAETHVGLDEQWVAIEAANLWPQLAAGAGCRKGYVPSAQTKVFIRMLVEHSLSRACIDCGRLAEMYAIADSTHGDELCPACHSKQFPAAEVA